jgi:hypothetical protein
VGIFAAARYLNAAGASKNLAGAIFAYNHASWYVQSVLLRAKLIGGMPDALIGALTGLVEGHFPVAAPARYADDSVERLATRRLRSANPAVPVSSDPASRGVDIFAAQGSPVIAVDDGKIVGLGESAQLGTYVRLQDVTGNTYTYAHLGQVPAAYPVPKPVATGQVAQLPAAAPAPQPAGPASAGQQSQISAVSPAPAKVEARLPQSRPLLSAVPAAPQVKERLFAHPARSASFAAGGAQQVEGEQQQISSFRGYFSDVLHLARSQYTPRPLRTGAIVVAGTILGRVGAPTPTTASHLSFMIQPAGKDAPQIDPKPILDGWKLLEATAVYRAAGKDPFYGPGAKSPTIGQVS